MYQIFLFYKTNNFTQDIKIKIKHETRTYALDLFRL